MDDGQVVEDRETRLPLLLSPVRRTSQWSDIDELVDPVRCKEESEGSEEEYKPLMLFHLFSTAPLEHSCTSWTV